MSEETQAADTPAPEIQVPPHRHPVTPEQFEPLVGKTVVLENEAGTRQYATLRAVLRGKADDRPEGFQQPFSLEIDAGPAAIQESGVFNVKSKTGEGEKVKANGVYVQCLAEVPLPEGQTESRTTYVVNFG